MRRRELCALLTVASVFGASAAQAQGSAVQTHGSCATAMGAAGVASPCRDGSAVLFNPAALALQPSVVGVGWTGITTGGSFTYDAAFGGEVIERESSTSSVPFAFASYRISDRLAAGIGVFNPYGLHIFWPEDFEGGFISYDTSLKNIYIQPTISFAPSSRFSLGFGIDVIRSSLELNQRQDLATTALPLPGAPPGTTGATLGIPLGTAFSEVKLSGDGTAYTFHVGALAQITDQLSVGARYLHSADVDFEGDADFTPVPTGIVLPAGNPVSAPGNALGLPAGVPVPLDALLAQFTGRVLVDQAVSTSLPVPSQLVLGVAYTPIPALKLLGDYQRTSWSDWDNADIAFDDPALGSTLVLDYQDTHTYRLGGELGATEALALRAGFIYNTAAQKEYSVSALLPEAERNYYTAGLGYRIADALRIDLGYQLVVQSDRRGRVRSRLPGMTDAQLEALNVGLFSADAHVFNVTLAYHFGPRR